MRIEPLTPVLTPAWDRYIAAHPDGWFWHTTAWLAYQRAYRETNVDASFAIVEDREAYHGMRRNDDLLGVVPLMISRGADGAPEFSYSGDPLAPGLANDPEVARLSAARTLALAREHGVRRAVVASSPFGGPCVLVLPERPMIETPLNAAHRVVSLKDDAALWRGVRRSNRSLIHRAEERHVFTAYAGDSARSGVGFARYQALHRRLAALPRSGDTYRLQGEWLLGGHALVMIAEGVIPRADGHDVGAAYWIMDKGCAYYASGAYAVDDLACAVTWRSLLELRTLGVTQASLGWQGRARTEKERAIEFQKRGFGGADVPAQVMELLFAEVPTDA